VAIRHPVARAAEAGVRESRRSIGLSHWLLLSDETGQDSVLDVPMQSLLEFPGVPLTADDAQRLVTETA
jgi:hypothetical protein